MTSSEPNLMTVTSRAAKRIAQLIEEEAKPELGLRIYIVGGGCQGYNYNFGFEARSNPDDIVIESNEQVRLIVDPISINYLEGATVDYLEDLLGRRFVVENPHAKSTCGCGASFSLE